MKLAIVDVETTGGSPKFHRVIDVGIVLVDDLEVVGTYETLIQPYQDISPFITNMTHITNQMVMDAPGFNDIYRNIMENLEGRVFVAHNASFDYGFIKTEFERLEKSFTLPKMCTVRLSRKLFPQYRHHNLDAITQRIGLDISNRHRALPDALATFEFIKYCKKEHGLSKLKHVMKYLTK